MHAASSKTSPYAGPNCSPKPLSARTSRFPPAAQCTRISPLPTVPGTSCRTAAGPLRIRAITALAGTAVALQAAGIAAAITLVVIRTAVVIHNVVVIKQAIVRIGS